jgi:hypothetical protein
MTTGSAAEWEWNEVIQRLDLVSIEFQQLESVTLRAALRRRRNLGI